MEIDIINRMASQVNNTIWNSFSTKNMSIESVHGPADPYEKLRKERIQLFHKAGLYNLTDSSNSYGAAKSNVVIQENSRQADSRSSIPMQEFYDSAIGRENLNNSSQLTNILNLRQFMKPNETPKDQQAED